MSAVTSARPTTGSPVLVLAGIEAGRLVRHPVFVTALAIYVWLLVTSLLVDREPNLQRMTETWSILTAFCVGLGGFLAMYRITRSTTAARDVVDAAPVDEAGRSIALCLACLVPFGVAVVGGALTILMWEPGPITEPGFYGELPWTDVWLFNATVLLAALGGPLLGVTAGRWWSWPMAGAVTAVVLIAWCVSTGIKTTGFWTTLHHQAGPFTLLVTGASSEETFRQAGSWWWRVPYVAGLCALCVIAAVAHGADGRRRAQLVRLLAVVGALVVALLIMASATGPEGELLWRAR